MWSLIPGKENSHLKSCHFKVKFPNFVGKRYLKKKNPVSQQDQINILQNVLKSRTNGCNIVGCYMLLPFAHTVACCCVLLGVVAQS